MAIYRVQQSPCDLTPFAESDSRFIERSISHNRLPSGEGKAIHAIWQQNPNPSKNPEVLQGQLLQLPIELFHHFLLLLNLRSILNLSQVSRSYHLITTRHDIWTKIALFILNLKIALPVDRATCQLGYKLKKACHHIAYVVLRLDSKLNAEICQKIDALPIYAPANSYNAYVGLWSRFPEQEVVDNNNYFFKTVIDDNLHLVLIAANRSNSRIIWFNSAFNIHSLCAKECLYWEYTISTASACYINTDTCITVKIYDLFSAWSSIRDTLCQIFVDYPLKI